MASVVEFETNAMHNLNCNVLYHTTLSNKDHENLIYQSHFFHLINIRTK